MNAIIVDNSIDRIFYGLIRQINNNGIETYPRGLKIKELVNQSFELTNPMNCIIANPIRKLSLKYLAAELLWYFSGSLQAKGIENYASIWSKIKDQNGRVNSNYGYFVFHQLVKNNCTQFDWVVRCLTDDKDSRQAVINFNQPMHKDPLTKDFPCTISTQFLIRNNFLYSMVMMRSNDLIYGVAYDTPFFCIVHLLVYGWMKYVYPDLLLGTYTHTAASLHVYERHFEMINYIGAMNPITDISHTLSILEFSWPDYLEILADIKNICIYPKSKFINRLYSLRDEK